jgi:hypothetical protein
MTAPSEIAQPLAALFASAEQVAGHAFVALLDFESGPRYGLLATADGTGDHGRWARASGGKITPFGPGEAPSFVELLEHPRRDVETLIEKRAAALGLPALATAWSLPATDLVRAMLAGPSQHFARLAMEWLLPTELRELSAELRACSENRDFPEPVRALAAHLIPRE